MKLCYTLLAATVALMAVSVTATADQTFNSTNQTLNQPFGSGESAYFSGGHPYVGLGIGFGNIDVSGLDNGGFGYGVNGGYLMYKNQFAYGGEFGFTGYPDSTGPGVTVSDNALNFLGVGKYYLTHTINLTMKAGFVVAMENTSLGGFGGTSSSNTNVQPAFGLGAGYQLTQNIGLTMDWLHAFGSDTSNDGAFPLDSLLFGVNYTF